MAKKRKIAIYWLGSCGGCDEAIIDLNESLLELASEVDIALWPIAIDAKYASIERLGDRELALSIIHGNVRNSEHEEMAHLLRRKSQVVLAFGTCACFGGTSGLANFLKPNEIQNWVYGEAPTVVNRAKTRPQAETTVGGNHLTLPVLLDQVHSLNQVIAVDYYLPGCPPPVDLIAQAVHAVIEGKLPPRGSFLAPHKALCDSCPRNAAKPPKIELTHIRRIHEVDEDSGTCFLARGVICLGPATRDGCGATCLSINIPCSGCFGPVEGVDDSGAKFLSALASLIRAQSDSEVSGILDTIPDPAGCFYRFTQPSSILGRHRK